MPLSSLLISSRTSEGIVVGEANDFVNLAPSSGAIQFADFVHGPGRLAEMKKAVINQSLRTNYGRKLDELLPCYTDRFDVYIKLNSTESLTVQHEQSLADIFNAFMRSRAQDYGCRFHSFSLDGQDRDTGADYVLTDSDRFAIVEFKYSQGDLVSEKYKSRRLTLCQQLSRRDDMRALHDRCHFISWTEGASRAVKTNIYRNEICTQAVFGSTCGLSALNPNSATHAPARAFAQDFFGENGTKSLSLAEFESYVAWVLTDTSASTTSTIELLAHNPTSNDLALVRLKSIAKAQEWVRAHVSPPSPRNRYRYGI